MKNFIRNRSVFFAGLVVFLFSAVVICSSSAVSFAGEQEKPQEICPVMGGKINKSIFVDHQGNRIYLCCAACIDQFKKDPDKYMKKLSAEKIVLEALPQEKGQCQSGEKNKGTEKHICKGTCGGKKK